MIQKIKCQLGFHEYSLGKAICIKCSHEEKCHKHNEVLYIHGWEAYEDCLSCKKEGMKRECHYCGYEYEDPKYCSVSGRTADKHKWL